MITLLNIHKQFGSKILFQDCSLQIGPKDRIGLIGPNGCGKTTLFKMILGEEGIDRGEILIPKGLKIGYLPQEVTYLYGKTVLEEVLKDLQPTSIKEKINVLEDKLSTVKNPEEQLKLSEEYGKLQEQYRIIGGYSIEAEAKRILKGLGFRDNDFLRSLKELSGGWLMRIALAKILLQSPELILLDEPTNYLDLQSLIWLEEFLLNYPGAMVIVSHDRVFLNHLVNKIAEIEGEKINIYSGNYDRYLEEKELRREILEATYKTQKRKVEQTQRFIERFRAKNTKSSLVQSRIKMLEKLELIEPPKEDKEIYFKFPAPKRSGYKVIEIKNLHKRYGEKIVYQGINLIIYRGDKIALVGPNGAGKSTLLKIMAGVLDFEDGEIILGKDVTRAYFSQYQLDILSPNNTVFEELLSIATEESETQLRTLLGAFLFRGDEIYKKVSVLSGGEKSRLILAKMLLKPANFLLLDEPTSHLDIPSRDVLENALKQFQGTICLITHDRHLINEVANKIIEIEQGVPIIYTGNYEYYIFKKGQTQSQDVKSYKKETRESKKETQMGQKEDKRRILREINQLKKKRETLEKKFQDVEKSLQETTEKLDFLNQRLSNPNLYLNQKETFETIEAHNKTKERLKELTQIWEFIALELEELKMEELSLIENGHLSN